MPAQGQGEVEIRSISVGLRSLLQRGLKSLRVLRLGLDWASVGRVLAWCAQALGPTPAQHKSGCGGAHL